MTYLVGLSNRMDLNEGRCCEVSVQGSFCLSMKVLFIVQDGLNGGLGPTVLSCQPYKKEPKKASVRQSPLRPPCGSGTMPSKDSGNFSITASWQDRASPSPPVADGAHSTSIALFPCMHTWKQCME